VREFYKNNVKIFIFKKNQNKLMSKKPFNPIKQSTSDGGKKNELHVPDGMKNPE